MLLITLILSALALVNDYHFVINPKNLVPDINDEIRLEVDSKLKSAEFSNYSFYARSDKSQINSERDVLSNVIIVSAPNLKDSDYLYLQIENNKTKERYYSNKVQVFGRSVYEKYFEKLKPSESPALSSEVNTANIAEQTSESSVADFSPYIKRFESVDSNTLYIGLGLIGFSVVGALIFWHFFKDG